MRPDLLDVLECPFCGGALQLERQGVLDLHEGAVRHGVLTCHCCAYPVVAGIPYVRTGELARRALHLLGAGRPDDALFALLGAAGDARDRLTAMLADGSATYRASLELLSRDAEGAYLLYRFTDPTYLASSALVAAVGQDPRCWTRRALDVGGGSGHLTRALGRAAGDEGRVVLADLEFWKLWLARRFVAPGCDAVCCDANVALPFADGAFSLAVCSDAFHYIWSRRLLAGELLRVAGDDGVVALAHLHNALCDNPSAGMPLEPSAYRKLFAARAPRLFPERALLDAALDGAPIDLSADAADGALRDEPALALVATRLPGFFRRYDPPAAAPAARPLALNPLYRVERSGETELLRRQFPSEYYEAEYAAAKRYLPEVVAPAAAERYVVLDLPERYL